MVYNTVHEYDYIILYICENYKMCLIKYALERKSYDLLIYLSCKNN